MSLLTNLRNAFRPCLTFQMADLCDLLEKSAPYTLGRIQPEEHSKVAKFMELVRELRAKHGDIIVEPAVPAWRLLIWVGAYLRENGHAHAAKLVGDINQIVTSGPKRVVYAQVSTVARSHEDIDRVQKAAEGMRQFLPKDAPKG